MVQYSELKDLVFRKKRTRKEWKISGSLSNFIEFKYTAIHTSLPFGHYESQEIRRPIPESCI